MTREELYELADIESPADFQYYEQMADLLECPRHYDFEDFFDVLSLIAAEDAGEIIENYFNDLSDAVPDDSDDLVSVLDTIQSRLLLLAEGLDRRQARRSFAEELYKFKNWYNEPFAVVINGNPGSLLDAITASKVEKLGGKKIHADLSSRMNYQLEEISMDLGTFRPIDILDSDDEDSEEEF
ncbi:MAG: hypothetical protein HUJ80_04785 [Firmicutes bacterium]|nr:hypothetical protein [Bacillota bacterium]